MVFKFMVGQVAKVIGRKVNASFYTALYREIFKEALALSKNETEASVKMKQLGLDGTLESAQRQEQVLRLFPNDPKKVLEYLPIIWQVIFGTKLDDYNVTEKTEPGSDYPALIYEIKKCPICAGYGKDKEDNLNVKKIDKENSAFAAGLVGMLQQTANFILTTRDNPYRINITETKCFCRGDSCMELYCSVIRKEDATEKAVGQEEIKPRKAPTVDIDLDKIETMLSKPIDGIKEQLKKLIQDKMHMTPNDLLDHFRNYEDDMVRIIGFLLVHLINEPGRLIEKSIKNITVSKVLGHLSKTAKEMINIYVPKEIIADYQQFLIEILTGLAPEEMVASFKKISSLEMANLFFEGVEKGLKDLGVNFEGLKSNIWEELELQKAVDTIPIGKKLDEKASEEEKLRLSQIKLKMIQEIFMLLNAVISLPTRILISNTHNLVKSTVTSGGEIFSNVREHTEKVFDLAEQLKLINE